MKILFRFICLSVLASALPSVLPAQTLSLKNFNIEDGLAQSVVYDMVQDQRGFMWFATQDGVSRFDGKYFVNYSVSEGIATSLVRCLAEDYNGRLWLGTDQGISIIDGDSVWSILQIKDVQNPRVRDLVIAQDSSVWIATIGTGLFHYKNGVFEQYTSSDGLVNDRIYALSFDEIGRLWIGTDNGISVYNGRRFETIVLDHLDYTPRIRTITTNKRGEVWAGGYGSGLLRIVDKKAKLFQREYGVPEARINNIMFDSRSTIWAGMDGNGLFHYENGESSIFSKPEGLINNSVLTIMEDRQNNLWFGTYGGGVFRLSRTNIRTFTTRQGLSGENIISISKDGKGGIWVGTNNSGLNHITRTGIEAYNLDNTRLLSNRIHDIYLDTNGDILAGMDGGFARIRESKTENISLSGISETISVRSFLRSKRNGNLYMGTIGDGVVEFAGNSIRRIRRADGLANDSVFSMVEDANGTIWFATDGGLTKWDGDTFTSFHESDGLPSDRGSVLYLDSSENLWIGTFGGGLSKFDGKTFTNWNAENGLSSNIVSLIIEDNFGKIWVGTKRGFTIFDEGNLSYLNTQNGLYSNELNQRTGLLDDQNRLWFGTVGGLTYIDLDVPFNITKNLPTYVTKVSVMGKDTTLDAGLELSYTNNFVSFEFIGIDMTNPDGVDYRYRLLGLEKNWKLTNQNTIQYTSLPAGDYTFQLQSRNYSNYWSEPVTTYSFSIKPPFYRSPWFIGLGWFALVGLALLWVRLRENQLKLYNQELSEQVEKRTSELRRNQELFRLISENAADLIVVFNQVGHPEYCSPAVENLLGFTVEEFTARNPLTMIHPEDQKNIQTAIRQTRETGQPNFSRFRIKNRAGEWRYFEGSVSRVNEKSSSGENLTISVSHDVTSQIEFEERLKESRDIAEKANKTKSMFLASMSHELRTPLNSIIGFSQILERSSEIPDKFANYISIMHKSGEHLLSMINDILDVSKIEAGNVELNPSEFNIRGTLEDLKNMFLIQSTEKQLGFDVIVEEQVPETVYADFNKCNQILINLLSNAFKFTSKGSITLSCSYEERNSILHFSVQDTGRGIPEKQINDIFKPFQQVIGQFSKGTGLGLTISRSLAQMMGGDISVKSKIGEGSVFNFTIPYQTSSTKGTEESSHYSGQLDLVGIKAEKEYKVLIVDDVAENRELLAALLQPVGMNLEFAADGKEAIDKAITFHPDLILMDLVMPVKDGKTAMRELRQLGPFSETPIIAVTASGLFNEAEKMLEAGFDAYIRKPFKEAEFFDAIARHLGVSFMFKSKDQTADETAHDPLAILSTLIPKLDTEVKEALVDALEFTDLERIRELCQNELKDSDISKILTDRIRNHDYRFFITLNEIINPA